MSDKCRKMSEKCPRFVQRGCNNIFRHFLDNFCLLGRCFCLVTLSNARPLQLWMPFFRGRAHSWHHLALGLQSGVTLHLQGSRPSARKRQKNLGQPPKISFKIAPKIRRKITPNPFGCPFLSYFLEPRQVGPVQCSRATSLVLSENCRIYGDGLDIALAHPPSRHWLGNGRPSCRRPNWAR